MTVFTHLRLFTALLLFLLIVIAGCAANDADTPQYPKGRDGQKGEWVAVDRVVDGDTFVTTAQVRVRLIGVDAPESTKRHEPHGKEAAGFTKSRLSGQQVWLEYDVVRTDKYGRTLAYVYLSDGTFFNALLLAEGYAQLMTVPPNVKYAQAFLAIQRQAREANKGLWK